MDNPIINTPSFRFYLQDNGVSVLSAGDLTHAYTYSRLLSHRDMLDLADAFHDAAIKLRTIVAEADPGRAFEENQSLQFGAGKLEGDL